MIYSQVIWALALDRIVWHVNVNLWAMIGVGSVVCSLVLVSLEKEVTRNRIQDGAQYESITPFVGGGTRDLDLESLCTSADVNQGEQV